jgi:hypothetical protein
MLNRNRIARPRRTIAIIDGTQPLPNATTAIMNLPRNTDSNAGKAGKQKGEPGGSPFC